MTDDAERRRGAWLRGHAAEDHVAQRLVAGGARVLARNWRGGRGELDIVAVRERRLRFVEVKARSDDAIDPLLSITASKRAKLASAARAWLEAHVVDVDEVAFLVAVVDTADEPWTIAWYDDAFDVG